MYTGPHIIKDGLVFGYDTGYGIADNSTATRFYPGRPTDNLFATTAMELDDDAGTYTNDIESGTDSIGKYFIKDTSAAPWWSGLRIYNNSVRPLTAGVSYVLSFECRSPQSGWSWAGDANASGGGWSGNDAGRLSNTNTVFDSTGGTVYTAAMVNTWQRVTYRVTMKDSSVFTGSSAYPHDSFFTNTNNVKIYYRNSQFELGKTIATPFVNGTRSSTASLIDLKETTDIDVSNVSFDSTGQPDFDGTSDFMVLGDFDLRPGFTLEAVCFAHTSSFALWGQGPTITSRGLHIIATGGTRGFVFGMYGNDCDYRNYAPATNTWHHWVFTYDGTTFQKKFIADGVAQTPVVLTVENEWLEGESPLRLGINYGSGTSYSKANGAIAVAKVYNRPLSATEIKQNYNAYKNRFDI